MEPTTTERASLPDDVTQNSKEASFNQAITTLLLVWAIVLGTYTLTYTPNPIGEWDDYALCTASLINEHNPSVSPDDLQYARTIFPSWNELIDNYMLSGYRTRAGHEMPWYFCTYSLACVPTVLIFGFLGIAQEYAFQATNLYLLILTVFLCVEKSGLRGRKRALLAALLAINPIVFYLPWVSAEVFIFCSLCLAEHFWIKRRWVPAAIFISIASTLNPVILFPALILIASFLLDSEIFHRDDGLRTLAKSWLSKWHQVLAFASCFLIALAPLAYNYYNTGLFNLTAGSGTFLNITPLVPQRFVAYLFDLNFGLFPYYALTLLIAIAFVPLSLARRMYRYPVMMAAFFTAMLGYSFMLHINCGMSGIARYNAWCAAFMIFPLVYLAGDIIKGIKAKNITCGLVAASSAWTLWYVWLCGPMAAQNTSYTSWMPAAQWLLDKAPSLYNPLHSTFNSRVTHVDGGYEYEPPIVYADTNGYVRKMLVDGTSSANLIWFLNGDVEDLAWLRDKLSGIQDEEYISVGLSRNIRLLSELPDWLPSELPDGAAISFVADNWNADKYVTNGISACEGSFCWTSGKEMNVSFMTGAYAPGKRLRVTINVADTFNGAQHVEIRDRDGEGGVLFNEEIDGPAQISFTPIPSPGGFVSFQISLPDAASPSALGENGDERLLALRLTSIEVSSGE